MRVGCVGLNCFGVVDELLVKEELADVGDVAASEGGVSLVEGGVDVRENCDSLVGRGLSRLGMHTVDVSGAPSVVAGESGVVLQDTVLVGELDTTEHRVVDVACISRVTVAASNNAPVDTGAVAVPGFKSNLRDGLTSPSVNDLDVECQRHTWVAIGDVFANIFARNPCRTVSQGRRRPVLS